MTAVHHELAGPADAPPLLLSNSLGSTLAMWDPQMDALAGRFRVIRYDLRGHGRSPVAPGPATIEDLGADAIALLDSLGIERAHVAGVSLGGMVSLWLAIHAPDRVDRVVPCCTSARLGPPEGWADRAAYVRRHGTPALAASVVERWLTPPFRDAHPDVVAGLRAMVASTPAEGYAACCHVVEHLDLRSELARIAAPTLVISGEEDPATPPEHGELIASLVPGARFEVIEGAAHLANIERPDAFDALLTAFLA